MDGSIGGAVVLLGVGTTIGAELRDHAGELRTELVSRVEQAFDRIRTSPVDCLCLGIEVEEPMLLARRARQLNSDLSIVLLIETERLKAFTGAVHFSPLLGQGVRCVSANDVSALATAIRAGASRTAGLRRYRSRFATSRNRVGRVSAPGLADSAPAYLERLFDRAPIGMVLLDPQGRIMALNRQAKAVLTDVSERDLLGSPLSRVLGGAEGQRLAEFAAISIEADACLSYAVFERGRGRQQQFIEISAALFSEGAEGRSSLVTLQDVTDRENARRALQEHHERLEGQVRERTKALSAANAALVAEVDERQRAETALLGRSRELERSNAELEQFASVASHDLQEPLRKIVAFGNRLESMYRDVLDERGCDYLARMRGAATRMSHLIADLLSYSRVSRGPQQLEAVDLNRLVREVATDLEFQVERTGGHIEIDVSGTIDADPTQMRQLFQNLIGNGLKFHKPDHPPHVTVMGRVIGSDAAPFVGGSCLVTVRDDGVGFEPSQSEKIFAAFHRLHRREEFEGSGIGLAVCRRIVERHAGTISATSTPGHGASFKIVLPVKAAVAADSEFGRRGRRVA